MQLDEMTPDRADFMARVFVCGLRDAEVKPGHPLHGKRIIASGQWSAHFHSHPWVKGAETEGFSSLLRTHCIHAVKRRIMAGANYSNVTDLMPDRSLMDHWSTQSERYRLAAEWREKAAAEHGSVDAALARGRRLDRNWGHVLAGKKR